MTLQWKLVMQHPKMLESALRVVEILLGAGVPVDGFSVREIMHRAGLTYEEYEPMDEFLVTQRYVNGTVGTLDARRWISPTGLEFYQSMKNQVPQAGGPNYYGPVRAQQFQAVGNQVNSQLTQEIHNASIKDIQQALIKTVEEMVNIVKDELDGNELALYMHTAEEFKQEIAKPNLDKKAVHRWLSMLAFLSDVEGTLQLGERTLGLAFAVIPYLPALADALHNLLFKATDTS